MAGDLLPLIEGHFDTAVGAKQEAASYAAIAEKIGCKPEEILFLTDIVKGLQFALFNFIFLELDQGDYFVRSHAVSCVTR